MATKVVFHTGLKFFYDCGALQCSIAELRKREIMSSRLYALPFLYQSSLKAFNNRQLQRCSSPWSLWAGTFVPDDGDPFQDIRFIVVHCIILYSIVVLYLSGFFRHIQKERNVYRRNNFDEKCV